MCIMQLRTNWNYQSTNLVIRNSGRYSWTIQPGLPTWPKYMVRVKVGIAHTVATMTWIYKSSPVNIITPCYGIIQGSLVSRYSEIRPIGCRSVATIVATSYKAEHHVCYVWNLLASEPCSETKKDSRDKETTSTTFSEKIIPRNVQYCTRCVRKCVSSSRFSSLPKRCTRTLMRLVLKKLG